MDAGKARLVFFLARTELSRRYSGTVGGAAWTIIGPLSVIAVIWFALDVGLGLRATSGPDFGYQLVVALVAWQFFSDTVNDATGSILRNPHLVKKVVFPVILLPITSAISSLYVHLVLLLALVVALTFLRGAPTMSILQLPLWIALGMLTAGTLGMLAASLNTVFRDTGPMVPFIVNLLFWLSPIIWPMDKLSPEWKAIAIWNPMAVVIEGYRTALLGGPFVIDPMHAVIITLVMLVAAAGVLVVFGLLRPLFADRI
ncbi:MAG: ABC transporter permease [Beijerinckiaceae bacterium]